MNAHTKTLKRIKGGPTFIRPTISKGLEVSFTVGPAAGLIVALLIGPQIILWLYSFWRYVPGIITDRQWTLSNYTRFLSDSFYRGALIETLLLGLGVTILTLLASFPVAYYLARTESPHRRFYLYLLIAPLMLGVVVRSFSWMIVLGSNGLVNRLLLWLGVVHQPLGLLYTKGAVVVGLIEISIPLMVLTLVASIERISPSVEEAAQILGANWWHIIWKIILPQSLPGIVSGSLLVFAGAITAYATPVLLGGPSIRIMSILLYQEMLVSSNWPFGAAIGILLMAVSTLLLITYTRVLLPLLQQGRR